jgi:DNA topoisomerase II
MEESVASKYVKLSQREHVLARPNMYIGSTEPDTIETWTLDPTTHTAQFKPVTFTPGLYKIFDEVLVNAIDHATRTRMQRTEDSSVVKSIKVVIDAESGEIDVWNDGDGIEVAMHPEHDIYVPELIFGHMLTSTNYSDDDARVIGGVNGVGAKACNIFSERFRIETVDAKRKLMYVQEFSKNMSVRGAPKVKSCAKKPYTRITFLPDYDRFKLAGLDEEMYGLFAKRVYDACALTPSDVAVTFDGAKLDFKTFERYADVFIGPKDAVVRTYEAFPDQGWEVVAAPSDDGFRHASFVNGLCTLRGGRHVDYVVTQLTKKLGDLIEKRNKGVTVKPAMVRENLFVMVKATVPNPSFDGQCKDTLTTPISKLGAKIELSDKFVDKLYKSGIADRVLRASQRQDEAALKKTDGKRRSTVRGIVKLDDANWAGGPKSDQCTLILVEGDSAKTMVVAGIGKVGRDKYGVFPLKGKLLNPKDCGDGRIGGNEEITHLKKIIGLESGKDYSKDGVTSLRYGRIMVLSDQDLDGAHIKGLTINLFETLWPSLAKLPGFLCAMHTPLLKARRGAHELAFYSQKEYENWKKSEPDAAKYEKKYYKGLATSTQQDAEQYFSHPKVVMFEHDGESSSARIDLAFNKKKADDRKRWLTSYDREAMLDHDAQKVSLADFIDKELVHFSNYDVERSIPCVVDGLKISQRKIMYSCFKRNLVKEIRVAQLAAFVSECSCYHHGEASLQGAIVCLAQDFVGSNNVNLLRPIGQFGSRRQGGKDSGSPRYIHTELSPVASVIFDAQDRALLEYLEDDGFPVEPRFYVPILPLALVNGALGIGTGFSTNVPCYDPLELVKCIRALLSDDNATLPDLEPYYRGFTGTIFKGNDGKWRSRGAYERVGLTKLTITELPIGTWTDDMKQLLEDLVDDSATPIKGVENQYTANEPRFTLTFSSKDALDEWMAPGAHGGLSKLDSVLKIESTKGLSENNMHLINEKGQVTKYDTPHDIVRAHFRVRREYYVRRKAHLETDMRTDLDVLNAKRRFIAMVVSSELPLTKMTHAEACERLIQLDFPKVDEMYDYLLNMTMATFTVDRLAALDAKIVAKDAELKDLSRKTPDDLWKTDLDVLEPLLHAVRVAESAGGASGGKKKRATGATTGGSKKAKTDS